MTERAVPPRRRRNRAGTPIVEFVAFRVRPELLALAFGVSLLVVYRAATQSITYDEAWTFLRFASQPWPRALGDFTANNHVLFTIAAKVTTTAFGVSELALRLPSVLAAAAYLAAALRLAPRLAPGRVGAFLAAAALTLNPLVLDFLVAARGYGMALAALLWGVAGMVVVLREPRRWPCRRLALVSLALGLAIAANLAFAVGAAAVGVGLVCALAWRGRLRVSEVLALVIPGALAAGLVLAVPLAHARREHFFYGADGAWEAVQSLVDASLRHSAAAPPDAFAAWCLAGAAALVGVICLAFVRDAGRAASRARSPGRRTSVRLAVAAMVVTALLLSVMLHLAAGVPYPLERTGLYAIPFVTIVLAMSLQRAAPRRVRILAGVALAALVVRYGTEVQWWHFRTWRFDASSRQVYEQARALHAQTGCRGAVASSWQYEPALRFYAVLAGGDCPVRVTAGWTPPHWMYEVYVLFPEFDAAVAPSSIEVVHVDARSGAVVAVRREPDLRHADLAAARSPSLRPPAGSAGGAAR